MRPIRSYTAGLTEPAGSMASMNRNADDSAVAAAACISISVSRLMRTWSAKFTQRLAQHVVRERGRHVVGHLDARRRLAREHGQFGDEVVGPVFYRATQCSQAQGSGQNGMSMKRASNA